MTFHDVRFPTDISLGSRGGPERRTEIVVLGSGHEERNTRWAHSRRSYNAGYGVKTLDDLHEVINFFEERRGRLYGFRWKDHLDFRSCPPLTPIGQSDQTIGIGDGVAATFQLIKRYGLDHAPYTRVINKPVADGVLVSVDGNLKTKGVQFGLNEVSGEITFFSSDIPASGEIITAGFEFDVGVRFDTDHLKINMSRFHAGEIPDIPIVEVRL